MWTDVQSSTLVSSMMFRTDIPMYALSKCTVVHRTHQLMDEEIKEESKKKRLRRQWDLLVKRADAWFKESEQPPNFAMMVLRGDRVEWKAPDHMSAFVDSQTVLDKFKEVALGRLYMPSQRNDVARETEEEPLALPYAESSMYTWDMLVFLIPAILRRNGIYGKAAYRPENQPSWWPRDVRFSSPNSDTQVFMNDNEAATCKGDMVEEDGEMEHPAVFPIISTWRKIQLSSYLSEPPG